MKVESLRETSIKELAIKHGCKVSKISRKIEKVRKEGRKESKLSEWRKL